MAKLRFPTSELCVVPLLAVLSIACLAQAPSPEPVTDQETELGQAVYKELRGKVEIIDSSPLYDSLKPVTDAISRVAQSRYPHPFKFFLVHEANSRRECLCSGLPPVFCEEHRGIGRDSLP